MSRKDRMERFAGVAAFGIGLSALLHHRLEHKKWTDGLTACHGLTGLVIAASAGVFGVAKALKGRT